MNKEKLHALPIITENIHCNIYGNNEKIKFNVLSDKEMNSIGFRRVSDFGWIFSRAITHDIEFTISILDNGINKIEVIDCDFGQHYDFQSMILHSGDNAPRSAILCQHKVYEYMKLMIDKGIISDYTIGEYI